MGRRKTQYDPQAVAYAVAEVAKGRSLRDVAAELSELDVPVSHVQVARWVEAVKRGEPPVPPLPAEPVAVAAPPPPAPKPRLAEALRERQAAAPPPPEVPADPDAPFDFEAMLKTMIREAQAEARRHDQACNPRGAQAAMKRAADLMGRLGQVEKQKPVDPDVLQFSKTEIERAYADMVDLLARLLERPVLCSECSRALSVKFGRGQ